MNTRLLVIGLGLCLSITASVSAFSAQDHTSPSPSRASAVQESSTRGLAGSTATETHFPQGVASGDVTSNSAIVWTRTQGPASLVLEASAQKDFSKPIRSPVETVAARDFTVQVELADLEPATTYYYRFLRADHTSDSAARAEGSFTTAPAADDDMLPRFLVGGDLGGQGYCRHAEQGYAIFRPMADLNVDFFIANGDMIYADNGCPEVGPDGWPNVPGDFPAIVVADWDAPDTSPNSAREAILGHWRYNRADPHHRAFLGSTPIYAQWDDHEVVNDFGAAWSEWPTDPRRPGYQRLVRAGRDSLFLFNPMTRHPQEPGRIYRSFRWGKHLEIFLLDARSYRSPNDMVDQPSNAKTMLGAEQLAWLKSSLAASDATWKIVSSDVPLSIPTGWEANIWGRDSFANGEHNNFSKRTGFESELIDLLTDLDRKDLQNIVFVVTDVHFAANLRYQIDIDGDGDPLLFHELINGPLTAYRAPVPGELDPTLRPITLYAEGGIFNFSYIRLKRSGDGTVHLVADVRDHRGEPRFGSRLELVPE